MKSKASTRKAFNTSIGGLWVRDGVNHKDHLEWGEAKEICCGIVANDWIILYDAHKVFIIAVIRANSL